MTNIQIINLSLLRGILMSSVNELERDYLPSDNIGHSYAMVKAIVHIQSAVDNIQEVLSDVKLPCDTTKLNIGRPKDNSLVSALHSLATRFPGLAILAETNPAKLIEIVISTLDAQSVALSDVADRVNQADAILREGRQEIREIKSEIRWDGTGVAVANGGDSELIEPVK